MSYECATVMHPFEGTTKILWGSLGNGQFIFCDPKVFEDAPPERRWAPQWWLNRLKRDQDLEQSVWVEDMNGRVLHREVIFS